MISELAASIIFVFLVMSILFIIVVIIVNNDESSCPKNKFLFINMSHSLKIDFVKQWGLSRWHKYEVGATCEDCGYKFHNFGVNYNSLLKRGIDPKDY